MSALPQQMMTVDEFLAWAERSAGQFELHDGMVIEILAQSAGHADTKFAVQTALKAAIAKASAVCRMLPDGMTVRIDRSRAYKPDALVYCGQRLPPDTREIADPMIVVEVTSPSTRNIDIGEKVLAYFSLPTLQHYIVIDPEMRPIILHTRQSESSYLTRFVHSGQLLLDPPGITLDVPDLLDI